MPDESPPNNLRRSAMNAAVDRAGDSFHTPRHEVDVNRSDNDLRKVLATASQPVLSIAAGVDVSGPGGSLNGLGIVTLTPASVDLALNAAGRDFGPRFGTL